MPTAPQTPPSSHPPSSSRRDHADPPFYWSELSPWPPGALCSADPRCPGRAREPRAAAAAGHLPVGVRLIDDQQHLGLPGRGGRGCGRVHQASRGGSLLHRLGQRAEEAATHRRRRGRLRRRLRRGCRGRRRPPLGARRGDRGRRRGRGRGRARAGGRRRRLLGLWPLQVCHVTIGQVGDEAAVRQPAPQEVHHLA